MKLKYGKESKIVNAYADGIMSLPSIYGANPNKVSQFYEKLCSNVQALETMGKLGEVNGYVRMTLNKLEGIRGDLVRTDDNWQEWRFPQLGETLRKWTIRNPPKHSEERQSQDKPPPFKPVKPFLPKFLPNTPRGTKKKTVRLLRKGKPSVRQLRQSDHTTRAQKGVES